MKPILHLQNRIVCFLRSILCWVVDRLSSLYVSEYYMYDELKEEYDKTGKLFDFLPEDKIPVYISGIDKKNKRLQKINAGFLMRLFKSINQFNNGDRNTKNRKS